MKTSLIVLTTLTILTGMSYGVPLKLNSSTHRLIVHSSQLQPTLSVQQLQPTMSVRQLQPAVNSLQNTYNPQVTISGSQLQ